MFYKLLIALIGISIFASCRIEGNFRGLYSYYKSTNKEHPSFIQRPGSDLCIISPPNPIVVYKINGHEIKNCLKTESYSVVYFWSPNCSAEVCVPPDYLQEYCKPKKIEVYIVAMYYEYEKMAINYNLDKPVFGINTKYYKTNLTRKYTQRFREDLIGKKNLDVENPRFLLFYSDSLIAYSNRIDTLETDFIDH